MAIPLLQLSLPRIPPPIHNNLSFLSFNQNPFPLLSLRTTTNSPRRLTIRNGGGPRTFPGGVSKWQWKRMQAKKAKQLLKARLAREREVYEMRKRAELKAAVAELERPWETVAERAPRLFSVSADEQVKVLADRFQKPGGFDMWSDRDGPQLFSTVDGVPSARFFPKGVVHSTKPYGKIDETSYGAEKLSLPGSFSEDEYDFESNGHSNSGRSSDNLSGEGQIKASGWIGSTVNRNERSSDGNPQNKPYKKIGRNSNKIDTLSLPSSLSDVRDNFERYGCKNSNRVSNSLSGEHEIKSNKWIKNPKDRKEMVGSNGEFRKQSYQKKDQNSDVAKRLSLPRSVSGVENDISRNGYENMDRFRGTVSRESQIKSNKWMNNSADRNETISKNGKSGNKPFGKFGQSTNRAENLSFPRSSFEFKGRVERNAYQKSDRFTDNLSRDGQIKNNRNRSTQNSNDRKEKSYSDGKFRNKESTRRVRVEKSNTFSESRC